MGDAFESIAKSFDNLAASVVALKGAIQVSVGSCYLATTTAARSAVCKQAHLTCYETSVLCSH